MHLSVGAIVQAVHSSPSAERCSSKSAPVPCRATKPAGARTGQRLCLAALPARYFLRRGRDKGVVDEVLDSSFSGVLVSDFYAAYNHYPGLKQRCWAHLLHLKGLYPEDAGLAQWAEAVHQVSPAHLARPFLKRAWNGQPAASAQGRAPTAR